MQGSVALCHFLAQPDLENCALKAYPDSGGVPTIGVGHTRGVKLGDTCTFAQAMAWLQEDMAEAAAETTRLLTAPALQNEFDTFTSLGFNIGGANEKHASAIVLFNQGNKLAAAQHLLAWDEVDGKPEDGVLKRRKAEAILLLGRPWQIARFADESVSVFTATTLSRIMANYA
jgi:lysozyme